MKKLRIILFLSTIAQISIAQNVGIGTNIPATSALLDISANNKGILIPRVALTGITDIITIASPSNALLVYNTVTAGVGPFVITPGFYYWNGTLLRWTGILSTDNSSQLSWSLTGNAATSSAANFLGTLDDQPLMLRQNNLWMGTINSKTRNYFIGGGAGISLTVGSYNSVIGDSALNKMTSGGANNVMGAGALQTQISGSGNVAVGNFSMHLSDSGDNNIGIGLYALNHNHSTGNIGLGFNALFWNTRANNISVGNNAGYLNGYLQSGVTEGIENVYIGNFSGYFANTGSKNVAIGNAALQGPGYFYDSPNSPYYKRNIVIGDSAMNESYGSDNIAIGYKTLSKSAATGQQIAIGTRALANSVASYPNIAIGYSSQDSAGVAAGNISLGTFSLTKNKQGVNNVAIGNYAMNAADNTVFPSAVYDNTAIGNYALLNTKYSGQTAVGAFTLSNDTGGVYNTALGYLAMTTHQRGNSNTAVGTSALRSDIASASNTAVGVNAMFSHKNGDNNVAMGYGALFNDIDGGANTAIGTSAMTNHKTGGLNTAIGFESMITDTSGGLNSAVGFRSLRYAKNGHENTAVGTGSIEFTDSSFYNTAIGNGAMNGKGGKFNTAIGFYASGLSSGAPASNYYVNETTTIGYNAGFKNIADQNTFVGSYSGFGSFTDSLRGIENTGIGSYTLRFNATGKSNTASGMGVLYSNATGDGNTGVGTRALLFNTTGNHNTAVGDSALFSNITVSNNTALGFYANTNSSVSNATAIGANAFVSQNNSLVLGSINGINNAIADTKVGIGTTTPDSTLSIANKFSVGNSGTVQYDNNVPVMAYMFKSGTSNANRMVVAHSHCEVQTGDCNIRMWETNLISCRQQATAFSPLILALQRVGVGIIFSNTPVPIVNR